MKRGLVVCIFLIICLSVAAQVPERVLDSLYSQVAPLTPQDEALLANVPTLKLSQAERDIPLPSYLNNAERMWMPAIFYQAALECGQASSICYTLSYELARRRNVSPGWGMNYAYPSHFAWNFCNGGSSRGVPFLETWEVIRTAGTPTVNEWGGWYSYGGASRWISGYETYYNAMKNRISEMYAIPVDNEEGLLTLKHWLYDHLAGENSGGLANYYCTYYGNSNLAVIPPGAPEAGKHIVINLTTTVNHSQTIVGYNDAVCWDYNGDGQYTNDIDINGDGVVTMKDWEIGAVIFCNTFGDQFGDGGYCYLPYCKLASLPAEGGIWNKCVYVVQVKDEVFPQITYKAMIRHSSREKIKLTAGIANNVNATQPEHELEFHVFNFQGGDFYMQGDNTDESNKDIELGLDVSPLLNYITPDAPCKFFFNVIEDDPDNEANGQVLGFSLMDYTSGSEEEQVCTSTSVPIANNTTTTLSAVRAIHFTKPVIRDTVLPDMEAFVPYQHTLTATGGKPPYRWEVSRRFKIEEETIPYPTASGQSVALSNSGSGYAIVSLPFKFPYYGDEYDEIVVYADGYIAFHHQPANWPFLQHSDMQTQAIRAICPFKADLSNCVVQKIVGSDFITLVYTGRMAGQNSSSIHFAVTLRKSGEIEFQYGDMTFNGNSFWSALVRGDQQVMQHTAASGQFAADVAHRSFRMTPSILPDCLTLSSAGVLSGKATRAFDSLSFSLTCYDNNDVQTTREFHISSLYTTRLLISDLKVNGSESPELYAGDTLRFSLSVLNADTLTYRNCTVHLQSPDPFIRFIDSTEYFGQIGPNNEYTLNNCVTAVVSSTLPFTHVTPFTIQLDNNIASVSAHGSYEIRNYHFALRDYVILNTGNCTGALRPIELDTLQVTLRNLNGKIHDVDAVLRIPLASIEVPISSNHWDSIAAESDFAFRPLLYVTPAFVAGTTCNAYVDLYVKGNLVKTFTVTLLGETQCFDFEDGAVPAQFTGGNSQADWVIDLTEAHSGIGSLRSGAISHNDTSAVQIAFNSVQGEHLMFAFRTSTENKYDWLYFYIDGVQQGNWAGEHAWTQVHYPVAPGSHVATWKYIKDYSTNSNSDCVWIDDICFAEFDNPDFALEVHPEAVEVTMGVSANVIDSTLVTLESTFSGIVLFNNVLEDEDGQTPTWVFCAPDNDFIDANGQRQVVLHFNSYGCAEEDHQATLRIRHTGGEQLVPVTMHVSSVGIPTVEFPVQIRVYPNPTSGSVFVQHESALIAKVVVTDLYGRTVAAVPVNDYTGAIDLSSLPNGLYLLKIGMENGENVTTKVIKN